MAHRLIDSEDSLLLLVDVQEKLLPHISNKDEIQDRCRVLLQGAQKLKVPILITEQYPKGLGPTLPELRLLEPENLAVAEKMAFGCLAEKDLCARIERFNRRVLVVCGIEAHVCVLQTVLGALDKGYRVAVVADAVGSRAESNRQLALARMRDAGAVVLSTEMILFEWLRTAKHEAFKAISALLK